MTRCPIQAVRNARCVGRCDRVGLRLTLAPLAVAAHNDLQRALEIRGKSQFRCDRVKSAVNRQRREERHAEAGSRWRGVLRTEIALARQRHCPGNGPDREVICRCQRIQIILVGVILQRRREVDVRARAKQPVLRTVHVNFLMHRRRCDPHLRRGPHSGEQTCATNLLVIYVFNQSSRRGANALIDIAAALFGPRNQADGQPIGNGHVDRDIPAPKRVPIFHRRSGNRSAGRKIFKFGLARNDPQRAAHRA